MLLNTHLLMSNIIFDYISSQVDFKLDKLAFAYGNIKPDLFEHNIPHTVSESLTNVNKCSEELIRENISIKEFSINLGVICHYVCDYFCLYHRDGNERRGILEHLLYELTLHIKLITLLLKGKLYFDDYEILENNVYVIIDKLHSKYNSETKSLTRDIHNALLAAVRISRLAVYSSELYYEQQETNLLEAYTFNQIEICARCKGY